MPAPLAAVSLFSSRIPSNTFVLQCLCDTPSYTVTETEAALRHYHNCEYVTQPLTDQDVYEMHTKETRASSEGSCPFRCCEREKRGRESEAREADGDALRGEPWYLFESAIVYYCLYPSGTSPGLGLLV